MCGECPKLKKMLEKKKKDHRHKGKRTKEMVATWSNDETSLDSSTSTSNQDSEDELCFMAFEDDCEEVNSNSRSLSPQEWEEVYELLHKKYSILKRKNKSLKHKITQCVHDTSLVDELEQCKNML